MGVNGVWIGYEGARSGYSKQQGKNVAEIFRELRESGINILASMIIGFDYQTPEIIREELDELLELQPTFTQFLIYGPTPGTPFYDRIQKQNGLQLKYQKDRELYYRDCTGFYGLVKHPTLSGPELEALQDECFETDFKKLGPSIIRAVHSWLLGYRKLISETNGLLKKRTAVYRNDIINSLPVFLTAKWFGPSKEARRYAAEVEREIRSEFRVNSIVLGIKSFLAMVMAGWTNLCLHMGWFQHPRLVRITYRQPGSTRQS